MTATRSRSEQKKYNRYLKTAGKNVCAFCDITPTEDRHIEETAHFMVIKNLFPYSLWDSEGVSDHLMITPKAHLQSLSKISNEEKIEYFNLVEKYESKGYNVYTRSPHSKIKTIPHYHTHLIKPDGDFKKFVFYVPKPYIRIDR